MVAADARTAVTFSLSPGQAHDGVEGRKLIPEIKQGKCNAKYLIMDKAYEGDETRQLAMKFEFEPVVPPKSNQGQSLDLQQENV